MKRVLTIVLSLIMVVFFIVGCSKGGTDIEEADINSEIAIKYLEDKGYEIVSNNGKVFEYVLKKEDLFYLPYKQIWGVQNVNPKDYVGKKIEVYEVIVKNHLLDNVKGNNKKQTIIKAMIVDNQVIGGYSLPDYDVQHYGGVYSLEGNTLEEVTGMSFQQWQSKWTEKYSK